MGGVARQLPASIRARLPPHAEAMEEDPKGVRGVSGLINFTTQLKSTWRGCAGSGSPLDSSTSAVTLMVKGKSLGMTGLRAFSASAPSHRETISIMVPITEKEKDVHCSTDHVRAPSCSCLPPSPSHWLHTEETIRKQRRTFRVHS